MIRKKRTALKIDECKIISVMDKMCAESLDPETHNAWENVRLVLITTRRKLLHLCPKDSERSDRC